MVARRAAALVALCAVGCATASPMLAPARVLPPEKVVLDVGTAYTAAPSPTLLQDVQSRFASDDVRLRAAALYGVTPPGVAPYVAGRAGLGHQAEGSVALIGRVIRIGARRELVTRGDFTLTAGLAARLALIAGQFDRSIPDFTVDSSRLYGGELSLVAGITRRRIYDAYVGLRGGYLYNDAQFQLRLGNAVSTLAWSGHRVEVAGTVGVRVGFGRLAVAVELETAWVWATGGDASRQATTDGVTLTPAGAVSYQF